MINQKGQIQLVIAAIVIVGLLVAVYLVQNRTNLLPKAGEPENTTQLPAPLVIQNDEDLTKVSDELDAIDVDSVNSEAQQLDTNL